MNEIPATGAVLNGSVEAIVTWCGKFGSGKYCGPRTLNDADEYGLFPIDSGPLALINPLEEMNKRFVLFVRIIKLWFVTVPTIPYDGTAPAASAIPSKVFVVPSPTVRYAFEEYLKSATCDALPDTKSRVVGVVVPMPILLALWNILLELCAVVLLHNGI